MMIKKIYFVGTGLALSSVYKKNVNVWEIDLTEIIFFSVSIKQPWLIMNLDSIEYNS
jgi:hypothetical protein